MGLGDVVAKAAATGGSLKTLIKLRLVESRDKEPLKPDAYLRASGLHVLCPREEALASRLGMIRKDQVNADLSLVFAHGEGLHYALQNHVLPDVGAIVGVWRCVECAKQFGALSQPIQETQSLVARPAKCVCGCEDFLYREQHFVNEAYNVGGHPDGFLVLQGMPGLGIVECKSIAAHLAWEIKDVPKTEHAIQTQAYMWLTGLKWAKILYWNKGGHGLAALTEHTLERDEETISRIQRLIRDVRAGLDPSNPLPARICATNTCPRAGKCSLVEQCFAPEPSAEVVDAF